MAETLMIPDGILAKDRDKIVEAVNKAVRNKLIHQRYWQLRNKIGSEKAKKVLADEYELGKRMVAIIIKDTNFV